MAGWLKRIFGGEDEDEEPEIEEEEVALADLEKWVESRSDSEFARVQPAIEKQITRLHELRSELKDLLKALAVAELHNPNIPDRERAIMEGNREAYIKQHKQFIHQIDITEDAGCTETARFCKDFEEMLVVLAKQTAKGHAVMGAFFAHHANDVNRTIKQMGDVISRMREILEDGNVGVDHIDDVRKAVAALRAKQRLLREMDEELAIFHKKLENSHTMKEKIEKQKEQLKQTDDYNRYQESNSEKEGLLAKVKEAESEVDAMFSPLSRAMKKYERVIVEDSALFSRYLDSPMKALASDEELKIIGILAKIKMALKEGSLELKDADKAIHRIEEITRPRLENAREEYTEARKRIKQIDDAVRNSRVLNDLDDLKYKMDHINNQIQLLQDKIENSRKTKEKIDLETLRSEVADKIREVFEVEVTITWQGSSHEKGGEDTST